MQVAYLRAQASALHFTRIDAKMTTVSIYPKYFDGAAWSTTAKLLMADALPTAEEQRTAAAEKAAAAKQPPQPQKKYATPLARAAAIAAAGNARTAPQTAPVPKSTDYVPPIKLTLSAGEEPCINAKLPRGMGLLEGMERVLEAYRKTQKT